MALNLLNKSELWINEIMLDNVNLTQFAHIIADVLGLERENVLVVDVRSTQVTIDILQDEVIEKNIIGKERLLLDSLKYIPGVTLLDNASVHSNGILGLICLDTKDTEQVAQRIQTMSDEIQDRISQRAVVFPTGFEIINGMIEDTNSPFLKKLLEENGFDVKIGQAIQDDLDVITATLDNAISQAYGLIITTGGVGAEDKDFSVEGVLRMDPSAETPYIVKYRKGEGRHKKDGVRIAVGQVGPSILICLPGPNDEVRIAAKALISCIKAGKDKKYMAKSIATLLREKLVQKSRHQHVLS